MQQEEFRCSAAKKCGGCQYQGISYREQLKKKQKLVEELLKKYGKVQPILGMEEPYYYRNKVHSVFGRDCRGNIISGTYQAGTHEIVQAEECLIGDRKCQEIIRTIRGLLKSFKIKTYDEDTGYGLLRHVLVRRGFHTGEIMVAMAAKGQKADVVFMDPPRAGSDEKFLSFLATLKPRTVVYISCNPETLARDLKYLVKKGYEVKKIQPVDMFPWAGHVDTVALLRQDN